MSIINEPSVDLHLKLNEQSFHIPYTLLRRNYKLFNELLERETLQLKRKFQEFNQLSAQATHGDDSNRDFQNDKALINKLNAIIKSIDNFEKKIGKIVNTELEILHRIDKRINFFKDLNEIKINQNQKDLINWYQNYTNILISDYLIRNGSILDSKNSFLVDNNCSNNSGVTFLKQQNLQDLLDYNILLNANKICKSLTESNELSLLIDWIDENKRYLNTKNSNLEFLTRLQQYIEFLKNDEYESAIDCLQKYLFKFLNTNFDDLKIAAGLLVYIGNCQNYKVNESNVPMKKRYHNLDNIINGTSYVSNRDTSNNGTIPIEDKKFKFYYLFKKNLPAQNINSKRKYHFNNPHDIEGNIDDDTNNNLCLNQTFIPKTEIFCENRDHLMEYRRLLDDNNWSKLNDLFLEEYYSLYGISMHEPLLIYLSLGISSLKTKACLHHTNIMPPEYNHLLDSTLNQYEVKNSCPVCSSLFKDITVDMPYAHHTGSRLFENPVMLPNGNIFDSKKLKQLSQIIKSKGLKDLNDNEVFDPIEQQVYSESEFIKMFPT